ncbi:MAG: hypothetical protein ACJ8C4_04000 [Gemmataceae bacterium]
MISPQRIRADLKPLVRLAVVMLASILLFFAIHLVSCYQTGVAWSPSLLLFMLQVSLWMYTYFVAKLTLFTWLAGRMAKNARHNGESSRDLVPTRHD